MGENGTNGHLVPAATANDAGGAFLALDPTNPKDQALIRREIARHPGRWRKMDQRRRDYVVACLEWAMRTGRKYTPTGDYDHPLDGAKLVVSAARTMVAIEGQNQVDEQAAQAKPVVQINNTQNNVNKVYRLEFDRSG